MEISYLQIQLKLRINSRTKYIQVGQVSVATQQEHPVINYIFQLKHNMPYNLNSKHYHFQSMKEFVA